jgi:exodeoxyribonuclease VII large subunit
MPDESAPPTFASLRLGKKARRTPAQPNLFDNHTPPPPKKEPPPPETIYTVRALVSQIRTQVESQYRSVTVEGEISNLRPAPSGHLYFTLKDGEAQLPIVLFRRQAALLRFRPKDGDEVRARGSISIYESRGQLQLIAETLQLRGAGALFQAFDQLKARLLAEGLFDPARKRPLPTFPHCIGLITSTSGAVLRDIVTVARRRHANVNILIYPAAMQGPNCAPSVIAGIHWFNRHKEKADLILIARGGGSAEDLAGFNDESLARAIAASTLPVVSAIGHETDFTIADFAADLRAPTPSAAAELITAAQHRIEDRLESLTRRARRAIQYHLLTLGRRFSGLSASQVLATLRNAILRRDQRIDDLRFRLETARTRRSRAQAARLEALTHRLRQQDVRLRLARTHRRLVHAHQALTQASQQVIGQRRQHLAQTTTSLHALSPLAVLNRGYALVYNEQGTLLRNASNTQPGQTIEARLAQGRLRATITETTPQ